MNAADADVAELPRNIPPPLFPRSAAGWAWLAAKAALSVAILFFAFSRIDLGPPPAVTGAFTSPSFWIASSLIAGGISVAAFRWSVLSQRDAPIPFDQAWSFMFAAHFIGQILPSSLGQDAVRASLAIGGHRAAAPVIANIALDRLCGVAALTALILAGAPVLAHFGKVEQSASAAWAAGVFAAVLALSVLALLLGPQVSKPNGKLEAVLFHAQSTARLLRSAAGAYAFGLSLVVQCLTLIAIWLIAHAAGGAPTLLGVFAAAPAALFVSLLPISLNGWGVREGALVLSLGLVGVPPATALLTSVLFGFALVLSSLPGAVPLLLRRSVS